MSVLRQQVITRPAPISRGGQYDLRQLSEQSVTFLLLKGFTGRGRAGARLRAMRSDLLTELAMIEDEISKLADKTRSVEHAMWVLKRFRRYDKFEEVSDFRLRWALRAGNHRTWGQILPDIRRMPQGMQAWYVEVNWSGEMLNGLWSSVHQQLKLLEKLIALDEQSGLVVNELPVAVRVGNG